MGAAMEAKVNEQVVVVIGMIVGLLNAFAAAASAYVAIRALNRRKDSNGSTKEA